MYTLIHCFIFSKGCLTTMRKGLSNRQRVEENLSASELVDFGAREFLIERTLLSTSVLNTIYAIFLLGPISAPILTNKKMSLDTVIYHLTVSKRNTETYWVRLFSMFPYYFKKYI